MAFDSIINPNFSEMQWLTTMQRSLDQDMTHEIDLHCCIFRVSKSIRDSKPESYTPQRLAFGPFHHFRPSPYMAHKFKLKQVKSLQSKFNIPNYQDLVGSLLEKVTVFRAFYSDDLSISDETLSWIMVIDGLFLLKLIDDELPFSGGLMDSYGRRFAADSIRIDAVMVENQVPFFVLEYLNNEVKGSGSLLSKTLQLCKTVSPVDSSLEGATMTMTEQPLHVLHLLYKFVCFEVEDSPLTHGRAIKRWKTITARIISKESTITATTPTNFNFVVIPNKVVVLITNILQILGFSKSSQNTEEKALIPSASQLSSVNVKLVASETSEGIKSTQFKWENATLVLPSLTLNMYSDYVIRNLLAFEATTMADTPKFARYIEIMAALIQTKKDVHLLKNDQIIRHDGDNDEVVKVFKRIKLDCIVNSSQGKTLLDGVIYQINEHYNRMWKIKSKRLVFKLVNATLKYLIIMAAAVFYLLIFIDIYYSAFGSAGTLLNRLRELELPTF